MAGERTMAFPAKIEAQEDNRSRTWIVTFRDLPEVATEGATPEEAQTNARDALETWLLWCMVEERDIPRPSRLQKGGTSITPSLLVAAKVEVYAAWRDAGISKVAFAKRLGVTEAVARRILNPEHATRYEQMETALAALGRRFVLATEAA